MPQLSKAALKQVARLKGKLPKDLENRESYKNYPDAIAQILLIKWPDGVYFSHPKADDDYDYYIYGNINLRSYGENDFGCSDENMIMLGAAQDAYYYLASRSDTTDDPVIVIVDHDGICDSLDETKRAEMKFSDLLKMVKPHKGYT